MFFFFKQKTAYGMRISDWSSDVCSSDLQRGADHIGDAPARAFGDDQRQSTCHRGTDAPAILGHARPRAQLFGRKKFDAIGVDDDIEGRRSEEHTSELQSLMRISYAVFCLQKKNKHTINKSSINSY